MIYVYSDSATPSRLGSLAGVNHRPQLCMPLMGTDLMAGVYIAVLAQVGSVLIALVQLFNCKWALIAGGSVSCGSLQ